MIRGYLNSAKPLIRRMREGIAPHMPYLLLLGLIHVILYRDYWSGYRIIAGRDFLFLEAPPANFSADCLRDGSFALWNPFINFGFPWVEHYLNTSLSFTHLLTAFLFGSSIEIVQRQLFVWILLGGIGIYLTALELGSSKAAAMITGICFMFCGQIFMLPRENFMIYNACTFPFLIYGYLSAKRNALPFSIVSVLFLTQYLMGGYMATGVLGLYLLVLYLLIDSWQSKKLLFGIKHIATTFTAAFLLSAPKLLPMYLGMKSGPRLAGGQGSVPDPYNLLSAYDLLSLLVPVKYFFSVYIGMICILVLMYCLIKKRIKFDALIVLALLSAWVLITDDKGNLSLARKASYYLPLLKIVRVEWLHWYFPSIFALLYCSQFMDGFFDETNRNIRMITTLAYIGLVSAIFFVAYNYRLHYMAYIITGAMAFFWLLLPYFISRKSRPLMFAAAAALALSIEFGALLDRVDINNPVVRDRGFIEIIASDQWGVSHSFKDDNLVRKLKLLGFHSDDERPSFDDSRNWPYLVSAIDSQFQENLLIDRLNGKRFAGWFENAQASHEFIEMFYGTELAAMDNQPLFFLADPLSGGQVNGISLNKISCSQFIFSTWSDSPSFLVLNQFFDKRWKAYIDGKELGITKANLHFMGLDVPGGEHNVRLVFEDRIFMTSLLLSGITAIGIFTVLIARMRRHLRAVGPAIV